LDMGAVWQWSKGRDAAEKVTRGVIWGVRRLLAY